MPHDERHRTLSFLNPKCGRHMTSHWRFLIQAVHSINCLFPPYWTRVNLTPVLVVLVSESRDTQLWLEAVRYSWNRSYSTHFDLLLFFLLFLYICILIACLLLLHLSIFHYTLYGRQDAAMDRSPVHHPFYHHQAHMSGNTWTYVGYSESTWASNERPSHRGTRAMSQSCRAACRRQCIPSVCDRLLVHIKEGAGREGEGTGIYITWANTELRTAQLISDVLQLISG